MLNPQAGCWTHTASRHEGIHVYTHAAWYRHHTPTDYQHWGRLISDWIPNHFPSISVGMLFVESWAWGCFQRLDGMKCGGIQLALILLVYWERRELSYETSQNLKQNDDDAKDVAWLSSHLLFVE